MDSETPEAEVGSVLAETSSVDEKTGKEYVLSKTLRLLLNLVAHILMLFTVIVCLVFACKAHVGIYELHIILCVIGYQFFMCQGALALAKYNVWSVYLHRLHRIHIHWVLQLIAVALVTTGSVLFILELPSHFNTLHGGFGMVALAAALLSLLAGIVTGVSYQVRACDSARRWFKYIHHGVSITTLLLSAISLCLAFTISEFKIWTWRWFDDDELPVPILMFITLLFTCSVALEFLIVIIWI